MGFSIFNFNITSDEAGLFLSILPLVVLSFRLLLAILIIILSLFFPYPEVVNYLKALQLFFNSLHFFLAYLIIYRHICVYQEKHKSVSIETPAAPGTSETLSGEIPTADDNDEKKELA